MCIHITAVFPSRANRIKAQRKERFKRKRLPNGFGQISEIKDRHLRKPFRVLVTTGKDTTGKPICRPLKPESYFATYNEAYAALVEYNRNPYDLAPSLTMQQLYDRWSEAYFSTLKSESSMRTITSAWAYCSSIYNMRVSDLRARHIKGCMEYGIANINGENRLRFKRIKKRKVMRGMSPRRIRRPFYCKLIIFLHYRLCKSRDFNIWRRKECRNIDVGVV